MVTIVRTIVSILLGSAVIFANDHAQQRLERDIFFQLCDSTIHQFALTDLQQYRSVNIATGQDTFISYFHQMIIHGFVSRGIPVFINAYNVDATLELTVRESSVSYGDVFTESFFGSRKTTRTILFTMIGSLISHSDGNVVWSKEYSIASVDTVLLSEVSHLREGSPPLTALILPERSLIDTFLEPAIITIAAGVSMYLFFTIRS